MHEDRGGRGRWYDMNAPDRDRMIVALRRRGWTLKRIGREVHMSESGVKRALDRIADGGFGLGMPGG
jgi:AraC-like DNA-binding protein